MEAAPRSRRLTVVGGIVRPYLGWLDAALALGIVLATAVASLVVEDLLTRDNHPLTILRWVALIVLGAGLSFAVVVRRAAKQEVGTLYYVRMLRPGLVDRHLDNLRAEVERLKYLDVRAVIRPLILDDDVAGGRADVASEVQELASAFQAAFQGDVATTGFDLAPNIEFPASLAFGYELFVWHAFRFAEAISSHGQEKQQPLMFTPARMDKGKVREKGFEPVTMSIVSSDDGDGPVLIQVGLTGQPPSETNLHASISARVRIGVLDSNEDFRPVRVIDTLSAAKKGGFGEYPALTHPAHAAYALAVHLAEVSHEYPDRRLVLAARVPKSVAVGAGWWLSQPTLPRPCDQTTDAGPATRHECPVCPTLWSRLVPLYYDQRSRALVPLRVHPAQPHDVSAGLL